MKRLIVVTQAVDPSHPVLAATVPKLRALAERVDELVVLADSVVEGALPSNVRTRTFGTSSRAGRGARLARGLAAETGAPVLVHMVPLFALLAAPLVRPRRQRLLLWYTQWHASRALRLAERVVTSILTVEASSFPFASPKVRAIGHGIDVDAFPCRLPGGEGLSALALGRYSRVKGYETVVRAAAAAGVPLRVHGPALNGAERAERARLEAVVSSLDGGGSILLGDALPPADVPAALADAGVLVSNTVAGAADKVVLEAAASCLPVLAPFSAFPGLLPDELRFPRDDAAALAERLRRLAAQDTQSRAALGAALREAVVRDHSVAGWADRVLESARS